MYVLARSRFDRGDYMSICILRRCCAVTLSLVLLTLLCSRHSRATLLPPSSTVVPSRTASPTGAALVVDTGTLTFASADGSSFTGTLRTRAYVNDPGNPFGLNTLTFTFLLTNNGPDALERLVTRYFGVFYQIDVGYNDSPSAGGTPGVIPTTVDRSAPAFPEWARVIGWNWPSGSTLGAHENSALLVIHTSGVSFEHSVAAVIDGSVATVPSFGLYLPEPTGIAGVVLLACLTPFVDRRSRIRR